MIMSSNFGDFPPKPKLGSWPNPPQQLVRTLLFFQPKSCFASDLEPLLNLSPELMEAKLFRCGKCLRGDGIGDRTAYCQHATLLRPFFQFVGFGQQNVQWQCCLGAPFQHHDIEFLERVADVHQQDHASQRLAVTQVFIEVFVPVVLNSHGDLCIAVARQIYQRAMAIQGKKIEQLRPSWRLAGPRQIFLPAQGVNSAGLAGVGAPTKSDFSTRIGRTLAQLCCTDEKSGLIESNRHF